MKNILNYSNLKIILASIISIYIFNLLINSFENYLVYESDLKLIAIILLVCITVLDYIFIALITKTFKYSDIKLKY